MQSLMFKSFFVQISTRTIHDIQDQNFHNPKIILRPTFLSSFFLFLFSFSFFFDQKHYVSVRPPQKATVPWHWLKETARPQADELPGAAKPGSSIDNVSLNTRLKWAPLTKTQRRWVSCTHSVGKIHTFLPNPKRASQSS